MAQTATGSNSPRDIASPLAEVEKIDPGAVWSVIVSRETA
jgi:hypothetical protein